MSALEPILRDLRQRRLWPVALVLLAALVAVPLLLAKSAQNAPPPAPLTSASVSANAASALPALSVTTVPQQSRLSGHARDPFAQQQFRAAAARLTAKTPGATVPTAVRNGAQTTSARSGSGGTAATGPATSGGTGSGSTTTTPRFPAAPSKPAPAALSDTQSYRVAVALTNALGGLDSVDPLQRLSGFPSDRLPLLIELGVLKGGHRVLFLVQPGTLASGPGACIPGPVDCEILSLAPDQIETVSTPSSTGPVPAAQFTVTAIRAHDDGSAAAAGRERRSESATGRRLLAQSTSSALSLFEYKAGLGAVVDLRDLTVGGG